MRTADFDYHLPEELIASYPLADRSASRMLVVHRDTGLIEHKLFSDITDYVQEGDHFVFNNTKVIPARYFSNDGKIEIVRAGLSDPTIWKCMVRPGRKMKVGKTIQIGESTGTVLSIDEEGYRYIQWDNIVDEEQFGSLALPHYMNRESETADRDRYQTVYAKTEGAIAAPTAGLHFTPEIMAQLPHSFVTLHVGVGTFRPVKVDDVKDHHMHTEGYDMPAETATAIEQAKRCVAVGTTSVRVLETLATRHGRPLPAGQGETDIFIYPGYQFKVCDALLTNFHLPQSTLIMLVSAFASKELIMEAYRQAVEQEYRFFSYGDCMLIL
ncbi:MAG: tRNA preQ1(34) S-adenosylmethionine ribosyltransferase-isomerase QueA [Akkermansia sp.]